MEDQAAAGRRRIDSFGQRPMTDAPRFEGRHGVDEVGQRSAETIELPDHENVLIADVGDGRGQSWPVRFRA